MNPYIKLFGAAHVAMLVAVPLLAGVLAVLHRWLPAARNALRLSMAAALLLDTTIFYGYQVRHGMLTFPDHVPLELCDASLILVILTLFTLKPMFFDLAYYWALAGASMALLTPNLWEPFPSFGTVQFFIAHGLTVAGVLYLLWSGQVRPRPGSVLRAMAGINVFAAVAGLFDFVYKTNYFYLRAKPANPSVLDYLGPWPVYLLATEGVALVLFVLLYLPVRRGNAVKAPEAQGVSV